jgi:hypothetical protein
LGAEPSEAGLRPGRECLGTEQALADTPLKAVVVIIQIAELRRTTGRLDELTQWRWY